MATTISHNPLARDSLGSGDGRDLKALASPHGGSRLPLSAEGSNVNKQRAALRFLEGLPRCGNLRLLRVTLHRQTFEAVYYEDGHQDGLPTLYCLGWMPQKLHRDHQCFTLAGDSRDWFLSGYFPAQKRNAWERRLRALSGDVNEYHPVGPNFRLTPWTCRDPIDKYCDTSYDRSPLVLDFEGDPPRGLLRPLRITLAAGAGSR